MTALYTFDVFSTLDGYGSYGPEGDWGGYWSKEGPEFLARRLALYREPQRMVVGANTMRMFMESIGPRSGFLKDVDPVNAALRNLPTTVVSATLEEPLDWPNATLVRGDPVDVVARLKEESDVPLRSHGSLSMNRALMAAGLVDRVQLTIFPVISGQTGARPVFEGASDFDLELIESRTFDGHTQELIYRPTLTAEPVRPVDRSAASPCRQATYPTSPWPRRPNRSLAVRGAPRQDAAHGDPAVRRRARPRQRQPGKAVDEGPCRRRGACPDRRTRAHRRGRAADRNARRRAGRRHVLRRQQPAAGRPRDRARHQGGPWGGPAEQAASPRARSDAAVRRG